jgi:ELWxxDGT repeat protein
MRILRSILVLSALAASAAAAKPQLIPVTDASVVAGQSSSPVSFHRLGEQLLFVANDGEHGGEVWRADGTTAGTRLVKDVRIGAEGSSPKFVGNIGNAAIFEAREGGSLHTIWRTDGTTEGTSPLMIIPPPATEYANGYAVTTIAADTRVFVIVRQTYDGPSEIFVTDGTADGTHRIGLFPIEFTSTKLGINGRFYFLGRDTSVGAQLWVSDGTLLGTHMVRRTVECPGALCGPLPVHLFRIGDRAYFSTEDALWTTDGTGAGTTRIVSMPSSYSIATSSTVAWLRAGETLYVTDGTAAGTRSAGAAGAGYWDIPHILADGRLALVRGLGRAYEIWTNNGSGMVKAASVPLNESPQYNIGAGWVGNRFFGPGYTSATGTELWTVDVDVPSAAFLKDLDTRRGATPNSSHPGEGSELGSKIVFAATDLNGRELWESDGTVNGTKLLADIAPESTGAVVSGIVRDEATGDPIANAFVSLCPSACEDFTRTNSDGTYRIEGVIPGSYRMRASQTGYLAEMFHGVDCPCPPDAGSSIPLTTAFQTGGIDFTLKKAGSISGTVRRAANGDPAGAVLVIVRDSAGNFVTQVNTNNSGRYVATGLTTGSYTVETRALNFARLWVDQVYRDRNCPATGCQGTAGDPVSVTTGVETANIDFSLHEGGTIAGTVRDASDHTPLQGHSVYFFRVGSTSSSASSYTDTNGAYLSPQLLPGSYYVRAGGGSGYDSVIYPDVACTGECLPSAGTPVVVAMDGATTGIDVGLTQQKARLRGIVRDRNGAPLAKARVGLVNHDGDYVGSGDGSYETGTDGRFVIFNIPPGTHYLFAHDELYPNVDCAALNDCNVAGATPLVLSAGQTGTVEMQSRSERTTISGRILDAVTGQPISYGIGSPGATLYNSSAQSQISNSGAGYTLTVISRETTFYVAATAYGYHEVAYPNVRRNCQPYVACPMPAGATPLSAGTHTNIDLSLPRRGEIAGKVVDAETGLPIQHVNIRFRKHPTGETGNSFTASDGTYRWPFADGSYTMWAEGNSYRSQVHAGRNCVTTCDPATGDLVTVADGAVATVDFRLDPSPLYGRITGRVLDDATGAPIANAYISARNPNGSFLDARTDANGNYTLSKLDSTYSGTISGQYRMYASAGAPYFITLNGGTTCPDSSVCDSLLPSSTPVQINAPNTTSGVDFRLVRLRITSVSPASGPVSGGTRVTIRGANFPANAKVRIGGQLASIVSLTPSEIVATAPAAAAAGVAHVTVEASTYLSVTLSHAFSYASLTFTFRDDPLTAGFTAIKAAHITELRDAVNALRLFGSLQAFEFTDPVLAGRPIRAVHILELRIALNQARGALGRTSLAFANDVAAGTRVRVADITELRNGVR